MRIIFCLIIAIFATTQIIGCGGGSSSTSSSVSTGISVDPALVATQVACIEQYAANPSDHLMNYAAAIGAAEVTDNVHSGLQPCAIFTGSMTGNNQVALYQSPTQYPGGIQIVVQGGPNAAFLLGGSPGSTASYAGGPYVARFNPLTGAQIWLTLLPMPTGQWVVAPSMGVIADGSVVAAIGATLYKLDPNTGKITYQVLQPVLGGATAVDTNFDGFMLSPSADASILMKSQNRLNGCTVQGNYAAQNCPGASTTPLPATTVIAVSSTNLNNLQAITLQDSSTTPPGPLNIAARPVVTNFKGVTYMYMAGPKTGVRVIWDPIKNMLTQDSTWTPAYLLTGQVQGPAPVVIGNWVMFTANGGNSYTTPTCATLVSQSDQNITTYICPWGGVGSLAALNGSINPPPYSSLSSANFSADPENSMIFMYDMLLGGVTAVSLNQTTGALKTVWSRPDWKISDYIQSIGPANSRVLISQYINQTNPSNPFVNANWSTYNYQESVLMVDQATGRTLAQSANTGPTQPEWLITPGYGGILYSLSVGASTGTYIAPGYLNIMQVASCNGNTAAPTPGSPFYGSLTDCTTDYSKLKQPSTSPTALNVPFSP